MKPYECYPENQQTLSLIRLLSATNTAQLSAAHFVQ